MKNEKLGFAGRLGQTFIHSKLTPVLAVASILLGLMAVYLTPKEEEPQISVPMIDIRTGAPGFSPEETERKVTEPIERAVWGLDGVEYVYSSSMAHGSLVTVRFKVGEPMEPSLVKIHHKLMTIKNELPPNVMPSDVKSFSIDDVPFLVLTFTSKNLNAFELRTRVAPLARELSSTPDLARVELLGGQKRAIRVIADPKKMQAQGVSLLSLAQALKSNDALAPAGKNWSESSVVDIEVGGRLSTKADVEQISIGQRAGRVVYVKDVAQVLDGPEEVIRSSVLLEKNADPEKAVSIVFAKRKGTNVVTLAKELLERANTFMKEQPNADIKMSVVRDYGSTAADKSNELIEHLLLATLSVSALIAIFMGIRASLVVAIAIPVTLALTLAIYYFMGYTLNRVTLFALIFSIGILVDDAIVVVENIERHLKANVKDGLVKATIRAVNEVGNPTILATFTVIAAILPMAFVRGLMGPYMKPIPVGASFAMILSLFVAFIVTPWAAVKLLKSHHHEGEATAESEQKLGFLDRLYKKVMETLLGTRTSALAFGAFTVALLVAASSLIYFKSVKVKMLPFDNKQEFQVLIDYPTNTSLKTSEQWSRELATEILKNKEVQAVQIFAGEPSPYSFSGMVKHTFLRNQDYQTDLQVVLTEKGERKESSHEVIESLRPLIKKFGEDKKAVTKVLEIPPGPPVLATMIAEVYGPDAASRNKVAREIEQIFANEKSVVDLDTTMRVGRPRKVFEYDQLQGGKLGTSAQDLMMLGRFIFSETPITTLSNVNSPEEVAVDLSVAQVSRSSENPFAGLRVPSFETGTVEADLALKKPELLENRVLHRKNLKPVSYVMSELSGDEEAPVYGILKLAPQIKYPLQTAEVPWNTTAPVVKWDGEWFITYEVFRDLGGAFAVVMVLIYILVLGWFRSFTVPLIIMTPIPISLIGILPGHAMLDSYFTATSMIGFIAGAGIIVRNSIILVDFIEHQLAQGMDLKEAVVSAGVLRFRPMLLTAAAVVVGSSVMLADPIFQGLAVSLIFGEVAATILSRFAVPVLYYWFVGKSRLKDIRAQLNS
ncbi:MAG: multidrug transporter AcrB [Bdellovibrio sp. ArHS]|uniref:efflux RND transporter permease subunit n=1 Tax=Bdellovibrio sp. ArHS TaxID=1569284 RepID=UPI000583EA0F|nr:efflux RND transporter permease subunit [Bdellovibrio sp. ArHS]KHD87171.1 MAG: multidrug transporter AcrB [Bdellovibrio sp. ArHS]